MQPFVQRVEEQHTKGKDALSEHEIVEIMRLKDDEQDETMLIMLYITVKTEKRDRVLPFQRGNQI